LRDIPFGVLALVSAQVFHDGVDIMAEALRVGASALPDFFDQGVAPSAWHVNLLCLYAR
jgi:hypothetical protein